MKSNSFLTVFFICTTSWIYIIAMKSRTPCQEDWLDAKVGSIACFKTCNE